MSKDIIKRDDLATNLPKHLKDIRDHAKENKLTMAAALQRWSPGEGEGGQDALLETMERRGLRTTSDEHGDSTDMSELFNDSDGTNFALAVAYLQQVNRGQITGTNAAAEYRPQLDPTNLDGAKEFAINSITDIPRAWAPYDMGSIEMERMVMPSLRLGRILANRQFITTANYEVPIFNDQTEESRLKIVAPSTPLPKVTVEISEETTKPDKIGYALEFPYEFFLNNRITIQSIAYFQRQRAAKMEIEMVNQALSILSDSLTLITRTGGLGVVQVLDMFCTPDADDMVMLDTMICERHSYLTFGAFMNNFYLNSATTTPALPGFGARFMDTPIRGFDIYRKEPNTITDLAASGTAGTRYLVFDSRQCLQQLIQRGGNVSETDRDIMTQTRQITNSFLYKTRTMAGSDRAAVLCNIQN